MPESQEIFFSFWKRSISCFINNFKTNVNLPCYGSTVDPALKWGSLDDLSSAVSLGLEVLVHLQPFDRSCSSWLRNTLIILLFRSGNPKQFKNIMQNRIELSKNNDAFVRNRFRFRMNPSWKVSILLRSDYMYNEFINFHI